jgi:hypothetical protein
MASIRKASMGGLTNGVFLRDWAQGLEQEEGMFVPQVPLRRELEPPAISLRGQALLVPVGFGGGAVWALALWKLAEIIL